MKENLIDFSPDIEIVSYNLVEEFTKAGFGVGYITKEFAKKYLDEGTIYELNVKPKIKSRDLGIVTLKNNVLNFASSKFIDLIIKDN